MTDHLFPLIATHRDGRTVLLYSIEIYNAFCKANKVSDRYVKHHSYFYSYNPRVIKTRVEHFDWIVRDDFGKVVKPKAFDPPFNSKRRDRITSWWPGKFEHRYDPVPHIFSHRKRHRFKAQNKKNSGRGARLRAKIEAREFKNTMAY